MIQTSMSQQLDLKNLSSPIDPLSTFQMEVLEKPTATLLIIFYISSLIGFFGNCIILAVILGSKKFRIKTNYLIANLCVGSLFYILYGQFAAVYRNIILSWPYGLTACQFYMFWMRLPATVLSFTTTAICSDRNRIVVNPMNQRSGVSICVQIIFIWILSCVLMVPMGFNASTEQTFSKTKQETSVHCIEIWTNKDAQVGYSVFLFLAVHLLPVIIMIRGMFKIRLKMNFLLKSRSLFHPGPDRRLRLMRNSCIFIIIFILCWLPTGVFRLPLDLPKEYLPSELVSDLLYYNDLCSLIGYVITCIIPLLLFSLSHDLRDHLHDIYICVICTANDDEDDSAITNKQNTQV